VMPVHSNTSTTNGFALATTVACLHKVKDK